VAATRVAVVAPAPEKTQVAVQAGDATVVQPLQEEPAEEEAVEPAAEGAKKKAFNPLEQANLAGEGSLRLDERDERTEMFSPIDVLDAAKVMQNRELGEVETKKIVVDGSTAEPPPAGSDPEPVTGELPEAEKTKWRMLQVTGEKTVGFSPVEAVQAGVKSRRPMESAIKPSEPKPAEPAPEAEPAGSGDATVVLRRPPQLDAAPESQGPVTKKAEIDPATPEAEPPAEATPAVEAAPPSEAPPPAEAAPLAEATPAVEAAPASPPAASESPAFMPIPTAAGAQSKPGAGGDRVDLGDDLLEGPTRIFTQPTAADKTEHLIKEIKHDLKNKVNARLNIDMLMKKAERYTAKRNYYLARKALRHAQALGADEETVKARLREIRKLELPEGLYNTISSDATGAKVDTGEVLERLEEEFDLGAADGDAQGELSAVLEERVEAIFRESDARTILDFGVGIHEMGLFRQAEAIFIRLVEDFPEHAFDAYYLAAVSKLSRRDYAGAASILKRLSTDAAKTDLEKIQVYYALGETFEKMRQPDRSKQFFRKVAEIDANYRNIRHKLDE
jgi:tetratricopeptide (TPR) repeat protein